MDVGAYNGDTIKKFYDNYDAVFLQPHAGHLPAQQPASARDFDDVWGWEANPGQWAALEAVSASGYPFKLVKGAAADHEGVWFYEGGGEGGSIVERTRAEAASVETNGKTTTPLIDFSLWLKSICTADDFVMCKVRMRVDIQSCNPSLSPWHFCHLRALSLEMRHSWLFCHLCARFCRSTLSRVSTASCARWLSTARSACVTDCRSNGTAGLAGRGLMTLRGCRISLKGPHVPFHTWARDCRSFTVTWLALRSGCGRRALAAPLACLHLRSGGETTCKHASAASSS